MTLNGEIGVWQVWLFIGTVFAAGVAWGVSIYKQNKLHDDFTNFKTQAEKDIDLLREKVNGLILINLDDGRHAAALAGLMSRNSPWRVMDEAKKIVAEHGAAPDLKEAWNKVLANGPLPEDDDALIERLLQHTTFKRLAERAEEVKKPLKVYLAIFCGTLREAKARNGSKVLGELGVQE